MKTFSHYLQNLPEENKLDKLKHGLPLTKKRIKVFSRPYPEFEHFDFETYEGMPPPKNSSHQVRNEINFLISLQPMRDKEAEEMIFHDKKIVEAFEEYLAIYGLEDRVDIERIRNIQEQSDVITLQLKRFYDRPRPAKLAKALGIDLPLFPLQTAETPSYPSGHALQGRLLARLISDELPIEHRKNILDIGKRIGIGRQIAGVHYPTDTEFGVKVADELYRLVNTGMEPTLKLEQITEMTKKAMQKQIADLDKGLEVVSNPDRIGNSGKLSDGEFSRKLQGMGAKEVEMTPPRTGKNKSSQFNMFSFDFDGKDYDIVLAGEVKGRGTKGTEDNEESFLLVLSALQSGASDTDLLDKMKDKNVYGKVGITAERAQNLVDYLENKTDWLISHKAQCKALMKVIGKKQPKKYVKDDSKLDINRQAVKLFKSDMGMNMSRSLDKWNPADVWLYYDSSVPEHSTIAELNKYLYDSIKGKKGIIGISLKKGIGKLDYKNYYPPEEKELSKIDLKLSAVSSLSGTIKFVGDPAIEAQSLAFRIFQAKDTDRIRGEAEKKGAEAVQGKVQLAMLDKFTGRKFDSNIKKAGGPDIIELKGKEYVLTRNGKKQFAQASKSWKKISRRRNLVFARGATAKQYTDAFKNENNFLKWLNDQDMLENAAKSWANSKFQVLKLFELIDTMGEDGEKKLAMNLLKYASSESDFSAAHLKLE